MIDGRVNDSLEAVVKVRVRSSGGDSDVEAVVDTGFNGYLTLPRAMVEELNLEFSNVVTAELGDGSVVALRKYKAVLDWAAGETGTLEILVLESGGTPLIGMSLLEGHRLTIDVVEGGAVGIHAY